MTWKTSEYLDFIVFFFFQFVDFSSFNYEKRMTLNWRRKMKYSFPWISLFILLICIGLSGMFLRINIFNMLYVSTKYIYIICSRCNLNEICTNGKMKKKPLEIMIIIMVLWWPQETWRTGVVFFTEQSTCKRGHGPRRPPPPPECVLRAQDSLSE